MSADTAIYIETPFVDDLLLLSEPITQAGVLYPGQGLLLRGTILGIDAGSGAWRRQALPAVGILAADCDATVAAEGIIYVQGKFNVARIIWPPVSTQVEAVAQLWDRGVYLISILKRDGMYLSLLGAYMDVTLSPTGATPAAAGGAASFIVAVDASSPGAAWFPTKDASAAWLTIDGPAIPQTHSGLVNYTVAVNGPAQPERAANIYVSGKTFTVTQAAGVFG